MSLFKTGEIAPKNYSFIDHIADSAKNLSQGSAGSLSAKFGANQSYTEPTERIATEKSPLFKGSQNLNAKDRSRHSLLQSM